MIRHLHPGTLLRSLILLSAAGASMLCAPSASADTVTVDSVVYTLKSDKTAEATSYSAKGKHIVTIPATVSSDGQDYKVTSIAAKAFQNKLVRKITLGANVTKVGTSAFSGCTSLGYAILNDGLTSIGASAFSGCILSSFEIPASVTSIGLGVLYDNSQLKTITVADGNSVFKVQDGLLINSRTNVLLASVVRDGAVSIPDGIVEVGTYTFALMPGITAITIPSSVRTIDAFAFYGTGITSISIPSSVKVLDNGVFRETRLTSAEIPAGVTTLNQQLFYKCTDLRSLTLHEGVTKVDNWALVSTGLTSLDIPASLTDIVPGSIRRNFDLTSISVASGNSVYKSLGGLVVEKTSGQVVAGTAPKGEFSVPEGVVSIAPYTFSYLPGLTKVTFPASLRTIGREAFYKCSALKEVVLGDGVEEIGELCFQECTALTTVSFGKGLKRILTQGFDRCESLKEAILPDGLEELGFAAFYECPGLKKVRIPASAKTIDSSVFAEATSLTDVTLEEGLLKLGDGLFYSCSGLTQIKLPSTLKELTETSLYGTAIREIQLPEGLEVIGHASLYSTQLEEVIIPNSVKRVEKLALGWCPKLKRVKCGSGLRVLEERAIHVADLLEEVELNEGLDSIGDFAISFGLRLKKITIPASVTFLGKRIFAADPLDTLVNKAATPQKLTDMLTCTGKSEPNYDSVVLMVPAESLDAYRQADIWKEYLTILPIDNAVSTIDEGTEAVILEIYTPEGIRIPALRPGLNICRMSDGSVRKIMHRL